MFVLAADETIVKTEEGAAAAAAEPSEENPDDLSSNATGSMLESARRFECKLFSLQEQKVWLNLKLRPMLMHLSLLRTHVSIGLST
jgi:hypothetical protein